MSRLMTLAVVLAVVPAGQSAAQSAAKKAAPAPAARSFKVEVEQEGKPLAIKDHEVIVRRSPFALLLTLPDKTGVFVSVSFEPEIYETARSGKPFGKAEFRSAIAGAEGVANKDHDLMVRTPGDDRLHFWDCSPGDDSRFDLLTPQGTGCRGRRTVDSLFIGDESVAMAKLLRRPLHLVFFRGTLSGDGVVKESGRDWLTLYLDTVPDSQKAAAKGHLETLVDASRPMDQREAALQGLAGMGRQGIQALDATTFEAGIRGREAGAVADLRAILTAEAAYAAGNGGFFDGPPCLLEPQKCRPKYSGAPFLTMRALETTNGYKKLFLPGPLPPSSDEIKKAKASASSLRDYVVVAWPETFGETGYRAFCADSSGKVCFVEGASPPAKNGRCETRCKPVE